jgi:hypothetical protein
MTSKQRERRGVDARKLEIGTEPVWRLNVRLRLVLEAAGDEIYGVG